MSNSPSASRLATGYNQLPTIFWSLLGFAPIGYFCYNHLPPVWLYIFLAVSLPVLLLSNTFYDAIQLGRTTAFYERIGIRIVRRFTQDGDWVNRLIRRRFPRYKVFDSYPSIRRHLKKAYAIEKIHFAFFLFFLCVSVYALIHFNFWWAALISLTNLIFNIYPSLLQQYNRLRLRQLMRRGNLS